MASKLGSHVNRYHITDIFSLASLPMHNAEPCQCSARLRNRYPGILCLGKPPHCTQAESEGRCETSLIQLHHRLQIAPPVPSQHKQLTHHPVPSRIRFIRHPEFPLLGPTV